MSLIEKLTNVTLQIYDMEDDLARKKEERMALLYTFRSEMEVWLKDIGFHIRDVRGNSRMQSIVNVRHATAAFMMRFFPKDQVCKFIGRNRTAIYHFEERPLNPVVGNYLKDLEKRFNK